MFFSGNPLHAVTSSSTSKSPFCKIGLCSHQKPLRVLVLGQSGVGKTAMVVRFVTKRYIGEYDRNLEKVYSFHTIVDNDTVYFEILDTAGQPHESECLTLESNIRWAEAFILMYSVTDKCSFDECNRLKFLINYNKRRRRLVPSSYKEAGSDVPVVLVGNKTDQWGDRMVSLEDGLRRSKEIGCVTFHEISVRESIDQVFAVFRDVSLFWKVHSKCPKLKRSTSELRGGTTISPDTSRIICQTTRQAMTPLMVLARRWTEAELNEEPENLDEATGGDATEEAALLAPFRGRASTDGHLLSRPRRWRYPPPVATSTGFADRRMSISMRGSNASY